MWEVFLTYLHYHWGEAPIIVNFSRIFSSILNYSTDIGKCNFKQFPVENEVGDGIYLIYYTLGTVCVEDYLFCDLQDSRVISFISYSVGSGIAQIRITITKVKFVLIILKNWLVKNLLRQSKFIICKMQPSINQIFEKNYCFVYKNNCGQFFLQSEFL